MKGSEVSVMSNEMLYDETPRWARINTLKAEENAPKVQPTKIPQLSMRKAANSEWSHYPKGRLSVPVQVSSVKA